MCLCFQITTLQEERDNLDQELKVRLDFMS